MLKIAMISEHASPLALTGGVDAGGQNIYVANIALQLGRMGHSVDVFTRRDNPLLPDVVQFGPNVRVVHVPAGPAKYIPKEKLLPFMPAFGDYLIGFFGRETAFYDVMHANFFMSGAAALHVKERYALPLITTFHALGRVRRLHQGEADGFPNERFDIEDQLVRRSDLIIAECPQDHEDLVSHYQADPSHITVVPCGFDAREFSPMASAAARRALGWATDEFAILQLGRLVPRKGIDNVIRGFAELPDADRQRAHLYIVGGNSVRPNPIATPEIGRLTSIAMEHHVSDRVTFLGRRSRPELRALYCAADVFITTPWYEPFGITPVEAMACGTAVIGANVGGIKDTVVDQATGLLVPPNDPPALAAAMTRLINDPALTASFGQAGLERAQSRYGWQRVSEALAKQYARVTRDVNIHVPADVATAPIADANVAEPSHAAAARVPTSAVA